MPPELVEVSSVSNWINQEKFVIRKIVSNDTHPHCKETWDENYNKKYFPIYNINTLGNKYHLKSEIRGKELKLVFYNESFFIDSPPQREYEVCISLGFTGNFYLIEESEELPKYWRWIAQLVGGRKLVFCCKRKLSRFRFGDFDYLKRSPCVLTESELWKNYIQNKIDANDFHLNKPIYEYMMRQDRFNGVGNYFRSVLLFKLGINPFLSAKEFLKNVSLDEIIEKIKEVYNESYLLYGFQGEDWKNPLCSEEKRDEKKKKFMKWCYPYRSGEKIKDSQKRTFWYKNN